MLSRVAVLLYLVLLVLAVPWYWPADNHGVLFGMPAWVVVAIAVSACVSVLTALLLARPWPHEERREDE